MDALEEVVWMHPKLHLVEYKKSSNQRTKNHILYLISNNFEKLLYTQGVYSLPLIEG